MSYPYDYNDKADDHGSKFGVKILTARLMTLVALVVSVAVLETNDVTAENGYVYTYNDIRSYKYMFYVTVVGIGYTALQIPFAIHYMLRKKHLINRYAVLKFDFYADMIVAFLLATGAGAAFGSTIDLTNEKNIKWHDEDKMQDFFTVAYIPSAFLLVGCITCGISVVQSSRALTKS